MGYAVRVDNDRVAAQGALLDQVGHEVDQVAQHLGRIMLSLAGAAGEGPLGRAAQRAAPRWSASVSGVAQHSMSLGRATQQAAQHYALLEHRLTAAWSVGGGSRRAP